MTESADFYWVYIACGGIEEARNIGRHLLEQRLAACVNIFDRMESMYWWQGSIESANEVVLIAKTRKSLFESLQEAVKAHHTYDLPCVIGLPVEAGSSEYLAWLTGETDGGNG